MGGLLLSNFCATNSKKVCKREVKGEMPQCLQLNTRVGERYEGRCNSFAMMHFGAERAVGGKRMCNDLEKSERVGWSYLGVWVRNLNGFLLNT